jgi:phosphoglycolate phosphatase
MHILFDLDGTLIDPKVGIITCIRSALAKLDIEVDKDINLETYIGPPLRDAFKELCGNDATAEIAVSYYRQRFSTKGIYENQVYDGIRDCLGRLTTMAESIYVATSKPTIYSQKIIEHFDLSRYFSRVYGSNLDGTYSDKTELLGHILRNEGLLPQNTVMIGDRSFDIKGAKNNGVRALGVLWGYGTADELSNAGADGLFNHPGEIYEQLFE